MRTATHARGRTVLSTLLSGRYTISYFCLVICLQYQYIWIIIAHKGCWRESEDTSYFNNRHLDNQEIDYSPIKCHKCDFFCYFVFKCDIQNPRLFELQRDPPPPLLCVIKMLHHSPYSTGSSGSTWASRQLRKHRTTCKWPETQVRTWYFSIYEEWPLSDGN